ncbi:MAG: porin [Alphaproteobacteria bacterium]|jgi:predicted porin|nr:porin [Alphaproteobacteria bacterium]
MKKILYGTTALIAVSMVAGSASAADKIKLGLGGYWRAVVVAGDTDNDAATAAAGAIDNREHGFAQESEIYFSGKTTLDNGVKFGVMVQLEGETSGDQIDNTYIWADGSFGRIEFGETWGPGLLMNYGGVGEKLDSHGDFASHTHATLHNGLGLNSYSGAAGLISTPEQKINYFTPRMGGFQLGIGYVPENKTGSASTTNSDASALDTKLQGTVANEMIDVGANYTGKFGGASVQAYGDYTTSETESTAIGVAAGKDADIWGVGMAIGMSGFKVGGKYTKAENQGGVAATAATLERVNWRIGADYSTGPWSVGIVYHKANQEIAGAVAGTKSARDDETKYISVGGTYNLGPGIKLFGGLQFWDFQDSANVAAASPGTEGDNTIGVIGTKLSF